MEKGPPQFESGGWRFPDVRERDSLDTFPGGATASRLEERYDCLPMRGLWRAAMVAAVGASKHGEDTWKLGIPVRIHINHAIRHLVEYMENTRDGEDHLGHAAWRILAAAHEDSALPKEGKVS